eukprot:g4719.t1
MMMMIRQHRGRKESGGVRAISARVRHGERLCPHPSAPHFAFPVRRIHTPQDHPPSRLQMMFGGEEAAQPWSNARLAFFSVGLGLVFTTSAFLAFGPEAIVGKILALPVVKLQEESFEKASVCPDLIRVVGFPMQIVSSSRKSKLVGEDKERTLRMRYRVRGPSGEATIFSVGDVDTGASTFIGFRSDEENDSIRRIEGELPGSVDTRED